jgi:hypothetical protein
MTANRLEIVLAVATLSFSAIAVMRWRAARVETSVASAPRPASVATLATIDAGSLAQSASAARDHDPFRLSRVPAEIAFVPRSVAAAAPAAAPSFRGPLHLRGIVGGPPWQAIVDGLPGQPPGTVVSAGKTFDKIVVRSITRDTVVIQAPDTVWRLTLNKGGQ